MIRSLANSPALGMETTLRFRYNISKTSPRVFIAHRRPRVLHTTTVQASLWSLGDDIVNALHTGTTIAIVLGLGLSSLPLFTGDSKERNERRFLQPNEEEGDDNIRWSVMSALAFLPFLNPMAWVFGALDDEDSSVLYWSFAWIYAMPYVANGFELDGYAIAALLVGIAHMQVERIAQTEPVEVELPQVLRSFLRSLPRALTALGRYGAIIGEEVSGRVGRSADAQKRKPDRKYLEEKSREEGMQLDEFDRKIREKERKKRGL